MDAHVRLSTLRLPTRAFPCLTLKYRRHSDGHYCDEQFDGASPSTIYLFRRRSYAPLIQTCTAGVCARACKSRREMRPRKLDEALSRHGRRARRVAFLSPRAMFSEYCSPLDYLYAKGKEGEQYSHVRGCTPYFTFEHAALSERVPRLDPVSIGFNTFLVREGGGATFPARRTLYFIFEYDAHPQEGRGEQYSLCYGCMKL